MIIKPLFAEEKTSGNEDFSHITIIILTGKTSFKDENTLIFSYFKTSSTVNIIKQTGENFVQIMFA